MPSSGPARLESAYVDVVDRPVDPEKVAMLAFMEEQVEVHIHTTADPIAEQIFEMFVNGERELFKRGETKTVKRKFIDALARRKITTFTQEKRRNPEGEEAYYQVPHTALKYSFQVTRDDHPRGNDWIQAVLREP
jgi:hypothetical protein